MGILLDLVKMQQKRKMLFEKYCDVREKKNRTQIDKALMNSLVAKLAVLDEEIEFEMKAMDRGTEIEIKLLDRNCILTKGYINDAGWDLKARQTVELKPGETTVIDSGVCVAIPYGFSGDIRPRSSASKRGLLVHYGTVDYGYTGEIGVVVTNLNKEKFTIQKYERIAQLVINQTLCDTNLEIVKELEESTRGEKGFGSTGTI